MLDSIFIESTEEKGILFPQYKKVFDILGSFLNQIEVLSKAAKQGNQKDYKDEINKLISNFKEESRFEQKPVPVEIGTINKIKNELKKHKALCNKFLSQLISLRKGFRFGTSYFDGILFFRTKMIPKEINQTQYQTANDNFRLLNYGIDWGEKVLMDLFNLVDQDLNLLTIIERMHIKTTESVSYQAERNQILFESKYNFGLNDVSEIEKLPFEIIFENARLDNELS